MAAAESINQHPERSNHKAESINQRPERSNNKAESINQHPERSNNKAESINQRPERSNHKAESINQHPERSNNKAESIDQRPERSNHKAESINQRPERSNHKAESINQRPERSNHKAESINQHPERSNNKAESINQRPERSNHKAESIDQAMTERNQKENICKTVLRKTHTIDNPFLRVLYLYLHGYYNMTAQEILHKFRESGGKSPGEEFRSYYQFVLFTDENGESTDANLEFRTAVTEALLEDFSIDDITLIRDLFDAELKCEHAIWRHDNLYQLSYYLYELGQYEDVFRLYEAKYGTGHMDASAMQDREMLHFGKPIPEIIAYVKQRFEDDAALKTKYSSLLDELYDLKKEPDYDNPEAYTEFIRGYFFGHEEEPEEGKKEEKTSLSFNPKSLLKQYGALLIFIAGGLWRIYSGDEPVTLERVITTVVVTVIFYGIFIWGYQNEDSRWKK